MTQVGDDRLGRIAGVKGLQFLEVGMTRVTVEGVKAARLANPSSTSRNDRPRSFRNARKAKRNWSARPSWCFPALWGSVASPGSISEEAERVGGEERPGVVLLEVEPPDSVVPAEGNGPPVLRNFGIGVERANVRPGLPGVGGRVADGGEVIRSGRSWARRSWACCPGAPSRTHSSAHGGRAFGDRSSRP